MVNLYILSVLVVSIIAIKITRKRTRHEVLITILFALLLNVTTDLYLDIKYRLYWYFDKDQVDWLYLIVCIGQLAVLVIIINYFPLYSHAIKKMLYIVGCTGILVLLELYAVYIDVLQYGDWNPLYSAAAYIISLYIIYFLLHYTADKRENK